MLERHVKQSHVAAVAATLVTTATFLAVSNAESDLLRVLTGYAAFAVLLFLNVWSSRRTAGAQEAAAAAQRSAAEAESKLEELRARVGRAAKVKRRLDEMELRLCAVENDAVGRQLAQRLWTDEDWTKLFDAAEDGDGKQTR